MKRKLINRVKMLSEDSSIIEALVDKSIQDQIQKGFYPPIEEWSTGSELMIKSFKRATVLHSFQQSISFLESLHALKNK